MPNLKVLYTIQILKRARERGLEQGRERVEESDWKS